MGLPDVAFFFFFFKRAADKFKSVSGPFGIPLAAKSHFAGFTPRVLPVCCHGAAVHNALQSNAEFIFSAESEAAHCTSNPDASGSPQGLFPGHFRRDPWLQLFFANVCRTRVRVSAFMMSAAAGVSQFIIFPSSLRGLKAVINLN